MRSLAPARPTAASLTFSVARTPTPGPAVTLSRLVLLTLAACATFAIPFTLSSASGFGVAVVVAITGILAVTSLGSRESTRPPRVVVVHPSALPAGAVRRLESRRQRLLG